MRRLTVRLLIPALVLPALLASCASTGSRYRFTPRPLEVVVTDPVAEGEQGMARALVSIIGVERAERGGGYLLELRLRIENLAAEPLVLNSAEMTLISADLVAMGPPRAEPVADPIVPPGDHTTLALTFRLPPGMGPGDLDLETLSFQWAVRVGDRQVSVSSSFQRQPLPDPYYYYGWDPYYYYPYFTAPYWRLHLLGCD
ncbi:MAG: hypothetical protein ACE5GW_04130 [Planctomycetota bacterium]